MKRPTPPPSRSSVTVGQKSLAELWTDYLPKDLESDPQPPGSVTIQQFVEINGGKFGHESARRRLERGVACGELTKQMINVVSGGRRGRVAIYLKAKP